MKKMLYVLVVMVTVPVFSTGCAALLIGAGAAAGAGAYMWIDGDLESTHSESVTAVHSAVIQALNDLSLPILSDAHDALSAEVKSVFADDDNIKIHIKEEDNKTVMSIRVGYLGDKKRAKRIYERVAKYLY